MGQSVSACGDRDIWWGRDRLPGTEGCSTSAPDATNEAPLASLILPKLDHTSHPLTSSVCVLEPVKEEGSEQLEAPRGTPGV